MRAHWSPDNTAMHSVMSYNGSIFIDEHDLVGFEFFDVVLAYLSGTSRASRICARASAIA
jgi:hypothetical protein